MKNTIIQGFFKVLCLAIISLTTLTLNAQRYSHLSKEEKESKSLELIENAEYMVEGRTLDAEGFYGPDKKVYTSYTIEVIHWYKGKGKKIIHLITEGGVVKEKTKDGEYIKPPQTAHSAPYLYLDARYLMVLKRSKIRKGYEFAGKFNESHGLYRVTIKKNGLYNAFYELELETMDKLNDFLAQVSNIRLPRKKKDVTFGESLKSNSTWIDNEWLQDQVNMYGPFHAGVGEILTIRGGEFGAERGQVLFKNADSPNNHILGLNDTYIDHWSNSEIRVIIPSYVTESLPWGMTPPSAGSGTVIVKPSGVPGVESETQINIEYSIINYGKFNDLMDYPIEQVYLGREHCLNGMVFTLHESFLPNTHSDPNAVVNPDSHLDQQESEYAIEAVEHALAAWATELGITLELERSSGGDYLFTNRISYSHNPYVKEYAATLKNVIHFASSLGNNRAMETSFFEFYDDCGGAAPTGECPSSRWIGRVKIGILKSGPDWTWVYDRTSNILPNNIDFYNGILHEIGHALGLKHDIDLDNGLNNLMATQPKEDVFIAASDRITLDNHGERAKAGATRVVADSKTKNWRSDFTTQFGVETLSNTNSAVISAPQLFEFFITGSNPPITVMFAVPFNRPQDYHWVDGINVNPWRVANRCDEAVFAVRNKDEECNVSSVYSLPITFPTEGCRDDIESEDSVEYLNTPNGKLHLYPNPTVGRLTIETILFDGVDVSISHIGVYNNLGRLQEQERIEDASQRTTIDLSRLPAGIYWVVWFSGSGEVIATEQVQKVN